MPPSSVMTIYPFPCIVYRIDGLGQEDTVIDLRLSEIVLLHFDAVASGTGTTITHGFILFRSGAKTDVLRSDIKAWHKLRAAFYAYGGDTPVR